MSRRDDFNIPDLGPAEPDRAPRYQNTNQNKPPAPQPTAVSGPGWIYSFVMIVLVVAIAGIAYWNLLLQESLNQREKQLQQMQTSLTDIKQSLNIAESSAEQSGQTMQQQLNSVRGTAEQKYKHFDSEIAKLWTVAYQRNKPKLESQDKALKAQDKTLKGQADSLAANQSAIGKQAKALESQKQALADQQKALAALESKLKASEKKNRSLEQKLAALDKSVGTQLGKLKSDQKKQLQAATAKQESSVKDQLTKAQTQLSAEAEAMNEQQAELVTAQRELTDRLAALELKQRAAGTSQTLERRVKTNEQAVQAFDSARRQLNRDLLQVRQKLNNLQLKIEQTRNR